MWITRHGEEDFRFSIAPQLLFNRKSKIENRKFLSLW